VVSVFSWLLADLGDGSSTGALPARRGADIENDLRRRLEPLLDMYPVGIAELQAFNDPNTKQLESELRDLHRFVAAATAQLSAPLPLV